MATPAVSVNPVIQTSAAGMFNTSSDGYIVGTAEPDPAARFALSGGYLASTETIPLYGGLAISENIPQEAGLVPVVNLGGKITRAAAYANLTGFSVFDQDYAMVNSPQSPVPAVGSGGLVNFYRLGSGARVALAIDPTLISLEGGLITAQVSWDFAANRIIAFATTALPVKVLQIKSSNCMVPVYNAGTGFITWNYNGAAALCLL